MLRSVIAIMLASAGAAAQQLPQGSGDPLRDICTGFLAQGGQGVSDNRNVLCSCLVSETQRQLTRDEMVIYSRAAETGQPPPDAIMQKVMGIATTCLTRAQ